MADDKSDDCFIKKLESAYSSYKSIETYVKELRAKIDRVGGSTPRNVFGVIYVSFHNYVYSFNHPYLAGLSLGRISK